jgi:hypothetical protein
MISKMIAEPLTYIPILVGRLLLAVGLGEPNSRSAC